MSKSGPLPKTTICPVYSGRLRRRNQIKGRDLYFEVHLHKIKEKRKGKEEEPKKKEGGEVYVFAL